MNNRRQETIFKGYQGCDEKIKLYSGGNLPPETGCDAAQTLEAGITRILNNIRDETGKVKFEFIFYFEAFPTFICLRIPLRNAKY